MIYPSDEISPDFKRSRHMASNSVGGIVNPKLSSDEGIFRSVGSNGFIVFTGIRGRVLFLSILKITCNNFQLIIFVFFYVEPAIFCTHNASLPH